MLMYSQVKLLKYLNTVFICLLGLLIYLYLLMYIYFLISNFSTKILNNLRQY